MSLSLIEKIKLKAIYKSCQFMGLKVIGGHLLAHENLNKDSLVFDFGANLGSFSREVTQLYGCKCICAEPNPILFNQIVQNIKIQKHNIAVSQESGEMDFFISENPEAGSFVQQIASVWGIKNVIKVKSLSYSDIAKNAKVDLLKVDIEGAEIGMFKSMSDQDLQAIPQITVEFHEFLDATQLPEIKAIIKRVESLGFLTVIYSLKSFSDVLLINTKLIKWNVLKKTWYKFHCLVKHKA